MAQIIDSAAIYLCGAFLPGSGFISMFTLLFFFGSIITGLVLLRTAAMVREKDEPGKDMVSKSSNEIQAKPLKGEKARLIFFTLKSPKAHAGWMQRMPERSLSLLVKWLRFDYWFMIFLYPFLSFLIALFTVYTCLSRLTGWIESSAFLIWLPLITGLMDVLENIFAIWSVKGRAEPNKNYINLMRLFSVLKWLGVLLLAIVLVFITRAFITCCIRECSYCFLCK